MGKIIAQEWKLNKWFRLGPLVMVLLLALWLGGLFAEAEMTPLLTYEGGATGEICLDNLELAPGIYDVAVTYRAEGSGSYLSVEDAGGSYDSLECNDIPLWENLQQSLFSFTVKTHMNQGTLTAHAGEGASLEIDSIEIRETGKAWGKIWWMALWLSLGAWLVWAGIHGYKRGEISAKEIFPILGLAGIWLTVSLPAMGSYLPSGADLIFHLLRIEGLKDGLAAGQFPVRIQPGWLNGYGYASSVFYGDFFLTFPVLMRMTGFSVQDAYLTFLMGINLATVGIAYASVKGIFRDPAVGLLGSMLYTWSPYRIYDLYGRAALGESLAITFLPLLCYGFYRIFTGNEQDKGYGRTWIWPVVAFTGIIQSHILTCLMVGVWVLLVCVIFWKRILKPRVFAVLAGTVVITALVNLWFLVPFLDYYLTGDFYVHHIQSVKTQHRAPYLIQYLFAFFRSGNSSHFNENGMVGTESLGIGLGMTICLVGLCWIVLTGRYKEKEAPRRYGMVMAGLGAVFLLLGSNQFPWDYLQRKSMVAAAFISGLQFPMRLLTISSLCFCVASCMVVWLVKRYESPLLFRVIWACLVGVTWLTAQFLLGDVMQVKNPIWLYNAENMGRLTIVGGEYLPARAEAAQCVYGEYTGSEQVIIEDREPENAGFRASNPGTGQGWVEVPRLYYKGYRGVDASTGAFLETKEGEAGKVRVLLEAGYEGSVAVKFIPPSYWRVAEAVSLLSIVGIVMVMVMIPLGRRRDDGKKIGNYNSKRGK